MPTTRRRQGWIVALVAMLASACSQSNPDPPPGAEASDAAAEAGVDASVDAAPESGGDAKADAPDVSVDGDAAPEVGSDATADVDDASVDGGPDVSVDATEEASDDGAVFDGSSDAVTDSGAGGAGGSDAGPTGCGGASATTSPPNDLVSSGSPTSLTSDGVNLYWSDLGTQALGNADGSVRFMPLGGGPVVTLATNETWPNHVEVADGIVYWVGATGSRVSACSANGCNGSPTIVMSGLSGAGAMAVDATSVYVDTFDGIVKCPRSGCGTTGTLVTSLTYQPNVIRVVGGKLYWLRQNTLLSCDVGGCPNGPTIVASIGGMSGDSLVANSTDFVWIESAWPGRILHCAAAGCNGAPDVLFAGQDINLSLAIDGRRIFWTTRANFGLVMSCVIDDCAGTLTEVATSSGDIRHVTGAAGQVFWSTVPTPTTATNGKISVCSSCGCDGAPRQLARNTTVATTPYSNPLGDIVRTGSQLVWLDYDVTGMQKYGSPNGAVYACDAASCWSTMRQLAGLQATVSGLVPTAAGATWVSPLMAATSTIVSYDLASSSSRIVSSTELRALALATDATYLYWVDQGDASQSYQNGSVMRATLAGGAPEVLASGITTRASGASVDATGIYWTDTTGLQSLPLGGGTPTPLVSGQTNAQSVAVDGAAAYWCASGSVWKLGHGDTTPVSLASASNLIPPYGSTYGNGPARMLTLDATYVYWAERGTGSNGRAMRVAKSGGTAQIVVQAQPQLGGLWVDAGFVYYTTAMGTVMRAVAGP